MGEEPEAPPHPWFQGAEQPTLGDEAPGPGTSYFTVALCHGVRRQRGLEFRGRTPETKAYGCEKGLATKMARMG